MVHLAYCHWAQIGVLKSERRLVQRDEDVSQLTYESLARGRPSRRMDPFVIMVPKNDDRPQLAHNGEEFLLVVYHGMFGDEINESGEKAFIQDKESLAVIGGKRNICDTFSELAANVILVCQWQVET